MSLPINTGYGIGLSGQPRDYTSQAVNQLRQAQKEEQIALADAKKARAKELDDLDKYADVENKFAINSQTGILPIDEPIVKAKAVEYMKYISEKRNKGENIRGDSKAEEMRRDLGVLVSQKQQSAKNFYSDANKDPNLFVINEGITKAALSTPDNQEALQKWNDTTQGTGIYTHGVLSTIDKTNYADYFEKRGASIKVPLRVTDTSDGKIQTTVQQFSKPQLDALWEEEKQLSPNQYAKLGAQLTNDMRLTNEQAEAAMKNNFFRGIENVYKRNVSQQTEGGATQNYSVTPVTNKEININIPQVNESGKEVGMITGTATARNTWELKSTIPIQKETIETFDPTTWNKEQITGAQDFKISSIIELPVLKSGEHKGKPMRTEIANQFPQNVEWKKFASGTTSKGEPKYIDYEAIKPVLDQRGIVLEGEVKATQKAETTEITSQKEYDALPKGTKYVSGGKTYIKK